MISPVLLSPPMGSAIGQRRFEVLRLSITPHCNLHCAYCRPAGIEGNGDSLKKVADDRSGSASVEQILSRVKRLVNVLPIREIHITGGEPTVHSGLMDIVHGCRQQGIGTIAMTTNGTFRGGLLSDLVSAGLDRLNVSLDAVDAVSFAHTVGLSPSGESARLLCRIQANIEQAISVGLAVKVNTTVLRGWNHHQILPVLEWARQRSVSVRFLELMRMGPVRKSHADLFVPLQEILGVIASRYAFTPLTRDRSATASLFEMSDGYRFGVIANHSQPFCDDCNRLRMDSDGRLFGCISAGRGIPFPPFDGNDQRHDDALLSDVLGEALSTKRRRFEGCSTSMHRLGG